MKQIKKVLVANRGEIAIRVFRACTELGIRTVAIYSKEDNGSYHRYKADEAYLVGEGKKPIDAYLAIEDIIDIAKMAEVDAIHPGYGFLSENLQFAKRCEEEGIIFIGPKPEHLDMFGDKIKAKQQAAAAGIPVIPGSGGPVGSLSDVLEFGEKYGYPLMIKAALGGGGRGMRMIHHKGEAEDFYYRAKSEAKAAFGSDEVYVEKLILHPKHIEVQILGDQKGNIVHLFERDCSVQRRHQKVVEVAPCVSISQALRTRICDAAVRLMKKVGYINAGTVEFLVSGDEFYFIEINPRVQVEHTITEMITGVDIVRSQILIAEGYGLHDEKVGIPNQEELSISGFAIQSRITTEDPLNHFMPDTGRIMAYRSSGGFGVRLDAGNAFQGAVITPYYDSLLVKLSVWALKFDQAAAKMVRNLQEFRVRGIKTNIAFLENVMRHPDFVSGKYDTSFIDSTPELFEFKVTKDRGTKMLSYLGNVVVNGFPGMDKQEKPHFPEPRIPKLEPHAPYQEGTKQILDQQGPEGLAAWVKSRNRVLLTDTTFRDAHQSLLATRMRTHDLLKIAAPTAKMHPNLFSLEMWGGATFDVAYRFLKEDPWERLEKLRADIPNLLFQMLLRASNAVGYKNYPDQVIREFVAQSAASGIDVFRIFDSLNWVKGMEVAIGAVRDANKVAEAAICYTGDISDPSRQKYNLAYYKELATELEKQGAHILAIKDMAGLLKPQAAYRLISELKESVDIPIHLHTHDTSGNGVMTYVKAVEAGVDIVDVAVSSMAGLTSQPGMTTLHYALEGTEREPEMDVRSAERLSDYWEDVRKYYQHFESGMHAPHTEVYVHEMPGGQYSNLKQQAKAVGLEYRWDEVKDMYRKVNQMFGDIVKVTPSSKVVGDMALFMVQNGLNEKDVLEHGMKIDFPDSVVKFFEGYLGQPYGGFPEELQKVILKGRKPITVRPGELLEEVDFAALKEEMEKDLEIVPDQKEILSYALYPKVFSAYMKTKQQFGDVSAIDTPTIFYGMRIGETIEVEIEKGKTLIVHLVSIGHARPDGTRVVYFELNGQPREVVIKDASVQSSVQERRKADPENEQHIGATMPGTVIKVLAESGQKVKQGDAIMITEAMKMETTVQAPFAGRIGAVYVQNGDAIQPGDLLIEIEKLNEKAPV
ncbi:pyruvate carboxylase [Heyndrickxia acidiproducens]|uniref:pyruvate carboxylase n=1 Tax=Heyndrickxia acidiproducens TaxID=1121084 RepID=UPI0003797569|nr:pyruvate carboxylase [Heyndrickxia acidiproducens]